MNITFKKKDFCEFINFNEILKCKINQARNAMDIEEPYRDYINTNNYNITNKFNNTNTNINRIIYKHKYGVIKKKMYKVDYKSEISNAIVPLFNNLNIKKNDNTNLNKFYNDIIIETDLSDTDMNTSACNSLDNFDYFIENDNTKYNVDDNYCNSFCLLNYNKINNKILEDIVETMNNKNKAIYSYLYFFCLKEYTFYRVYKMFFLTSFIDMYISDYEYEINNTSNEYPMYCTLNNSYNSNNNNNNVKNIKLNDFNDKPTKKYLEEIRYVSEHEFIEKIRNKCLPIEFDNKNLKEIYKKLLDEFNQYTKNVQMVADNYNDSSSSNYYNYNDNRNNYYINNYYSSEDSCLINSLDYKNSNNSICYMELD